MLACCRRGNEVYPCPPTHNSEKYLIFCAIGAILMVGAVFIFLSAQQILPASQNAISNLGNWGIIMAGGVFLLGNLILIISARTYYFTKNDRSHNQQIIEENSWVSSLNVKENGKKIRKENLQPTENQLNLLETTEVHNVQDNSTIIPAGHPPKNIFSGQSGKLSIKAEKSINNSPFTNQSSAPSQEKAPVRTVDNPTNALAYSLKAVIEEIVHARSQGISTALFVGRRNDQTLPNEEGWAWFSLDYDRKEENSNRHLEMDFNQSLRMKCIHHLFDKVIVDVSVIKFFRNSPWDALHPLLFKHESSQLIVESDRGFSMEAHVLEIDGRRATLTIPIQYELDYFKEEESAFNQWKKNVGQQKADDEYNLFVQKLDPKIIEFEKNFREGRDDGLRLLFMRFILKRENLVPKKVDYRSQLLGEIQNYLLTLFHNVELKLSTYPYRNEEHSVEYWVATNPK